MNLSIDHVMNYLSPLRRLGNTRYSLYFPLCSMLGLCLVSELLDYDVLKNPMAVSSYVIYISVALIIYFAFRDGIRGGLIATSVTFLYYIYIVISRHYKGQTLHNSIDVILMLDLLYLLVSILIGWLKQTLDSLMIREVEARRLAEEGQVRLRTILDQLPIGVLLADKNGGRLEVNRQVEKILGPGSRKALHIEDGYVSERVAKQDRSLRPKEWPIVRALRNGETVLGEEMTYHREDNRQVALRVNATPIRNKSRQIIAAVSTIADVTQERELERRKDDFVNMASHELKTPLTSTKLYIELLMQHLQKEHDAQSIRILSSIKNQTDRLQELVNDLLDVSRIQTGKLHLRREEVDLTEVLGEITELLQASTKHRLIFEHKQKAIVLADRFRIYQVVTNLVTNAIKYSPQGTDIVITLQKKDKRVIVCVKDHGIGIAKDQQKKIFDRLYQVSGSPEQKFPGLGMGLYISKEIIKRHKGTIWVEGDLGKGSSFYFSLPQK